MTMVLQTVVETCAACPNQWDAWTTDGQYLYLRYRSGIGTVDAYDAPGPDGWTVPPDGAVARFEDEDNPPAIDIGLDEFLHRTGLQLAPDAEVATWGEYVQQRKRAVLEREIAGRIAIIDAACTALREDDFTRTANYPRRTVRRRTWLQDADGTYYRNCPLIMHEQGRLSSLLFPWRYFRLAAEWDHVFRHGVLRTRTVGRFDRVIPRQL